MKQKKPKAYVRLEEKRILGLIKRCIQICDEFDPNYNRETLSNLSIDELALYLKIVANRSGAEIKSWLNGEEAISKVRYKKDKSYIVATNEAYVIIGAFKWLADKGYLHGNIE